MGVGRAHAEQKGGQLVGFRLASDPAKFGSKPARPMAAFHRAPPMQLTADFSGQGRGNQAGTDSGDFPGTSGILAPIRSLLWKRGQGPKGRKV